MKNILIVGGSGEIGGEIAKTFANNNCNVAISYNNSLCEAENTLKSLREIENIKSIIVQCDVTNSNSVKEMVKTVRSQFGFIDTLVCCQGKALSKLITLSTDEEIKSIIDTNLTGTIYCIREVLPEMIDNKTGSIVTISSMWGEVGASVETVYSAAKAGIIGLTKGLAKEVAPSNIRVNCVTPGVINTKMLNCYTLEEKEDLKEETPLNRLGTPKDVAECVLFLASDRASFITGEILKVNGGFII